MYEPTGGEWDTKELCWEDLVNSWWAADNYRKAARDYWMEAVGFWNESDLDTAFHRLLMSVEYLNNVTSYLIMYNQYYPSRGGILYWLDNFIEADVTYKSICEAWGKDDFEGRAVTIAFIDRMRQLLWDEPYYAVWAAKPEEQEL